MNNKRTYDANKTAYISIFISLILVVLIYLFSLTLGRFQSILLEDKGASWYYWKLPELNLVASISAWGLYIVHQIFVWYLIYRLNKQPKVEKGKASSLNIFLLIVNLIFILLHITQTMLFYDGLAQNMPVFTSQGSVIVMLVMVLIMLNSKRGLLFGKKVKLPAKGVYGVFKTHGYYIAWAVIYTFWFHPTEGTLGHLLGFFYIFLLVIQLSLAKTSWHNNIKWITILEVYVAIHGAIVAIEAENGMWPMFMFGFLLMFIVTQAYGITNKKSTLIGVTIAYTSLALLVFSGVLGNSNTLSDIHQITWIPIILYALVFVIVYLYQGVSLVQNKSKKN